MKSASANKDQLSLGPLELRGSEPQGSTFRSSEPNSEALGSSEQLAAELLHAAFKRAGLDNKDIAHLCGVSQSLVEKWRSTEARGCPSFVQMLCLPPSFHISLHREMNARFGFGRAALARLIGAAEDLALVMEK